MGEITITESNKYCAISALDLIEETSIFPLVDAIRCLAKEGGNLPISQGASEEEVGKHQRETSMMFHRIQELASTTQKILSAKKQIDHLK